MSNDVQDIYITEKKEWRQMFGRSSDSAWFIQFNFISRPQAVRFHKEKFPFFGFFNQRGGRKMN